ncbi:acid phosphatase [Pandoraea anhela]|uniref:Acid phosphatase n=1 Tax=Pandoraea anhela TaxID=2508295 RepID=A0A5E4Z6C9_9BURK|nr:phosphatase PAP2 family protein [Pandoraea anhela]VVE56831.1 acid phosphatase [Pandoraea anhela]
MRYAIRRLTLLAAAALCASAAQAPAVTLAASTEHTTEWQYLPAGGLDLTVLIPPPPEANTQAAADDLDEVLALQRTRTKAELSLADGDTRRSVFRFADVIGDAFNKERLPETDAFFDRLGREGEKSVSAAKAFWKRARPYTVSSKVEPGIVTGRKSPSYPSGHATFAYLSAVILSEMFPEMRSRIYARAEAFARGRVVGGVHFPSDVAAGKISGIVIAASMLENPQFRMDLARATKEARSALGLPPLPVNTQERLYAIPRIGVN